MYYRQFECGCLIQLNSDHGDHSGQRRTRYLCPDHFKPQSRLIFICDWCSIIAYPSHKTHNRNCCDECDSNTLAILKFECGCEINLPLTKQSKKCPTHKALFVSYKTRCRSCGDWFYWNSNQSSKKYCPNCCDYIPHLTYKASPRFDVLRNDGSKTDCIKYSECLLKTAITNARTTPCKNCNFFILNADADDILNYMYTGASDYDRY